MPLLYKFGCDSCDLVLPLGEGGVFYAVDSKGYRVICPHPGEFQTISFITGLSYEEAKKQGMAGFLADSICCACLLQFSLDHDIDDLSCLSCKSGKISGIVGLVGKSCPKCDRGTIIKEDSGIMT